LRLIIELYEYITYFIITKQNNNNLMAKLNPELTEWITSMGIVQLFNNQDLESGKTISAILQNIDNTSKI